VAGPATAGGQRPVTLYSYDQLGHLSRIEAGTTDAAGTHAASDHVRLQMRYVTDDFGRTIKQTDALGRSTLFSYDGNGNLSKMTDAKGQTTTFTWDYGHLLWERKSSAGNVTIARNPLGQPVRIETQKAGNTGLLVRYDITYDKVRNIIKNHTICSHSQCLS
jgi:YD repeat-containing protein